MEQLPPSVARDGAPDVAVMVARLRRIPDASRTYACDEQFAALHFGLDAPALRQLVACGLPCSERDGKLRFEYGDLHYIGLRRRSAVTFIWAARQWAESLARYAAAEQVQVKVELLPQLAADVERIPGIVRPLDGEPREVMLQNGVPAAASQLTLRGRWPSLPSAAAEAVARFAAEVDFYLLPASIQGDVELVRHTALSDCQTAARAIASAWRVAGLEARVSQGLFVSEPYSTLHTWPEVRVDDVWLAADPLMVRLMRDYGGLDAGRWPLERPPMAMLHRIEQPAGEPIVTGSGPVETTFLTTTVGAHD